jgi:S1-C subfamily serine protease
VLLAAAMLLLWGTAASATVRNLEPRADSAEPPAAVPPDRAAAAAVRIDGRGGGQFDTGSGVAVAPNVVLTNAHLMNDPVSLVTQRDDTVLSTGRIERASNGLDLAVAVTNGPRLSPIELAPKDPNAGETVTMIGYPAGERTVTTARIEGTLLRGGVTVLRFSPEPHPGQSGSPLIDAQGRLVGVAFAEETAGGQGLAIPVSDVRTAIQAWRADGVPVG